MRRATASATRLRKAYPHGRERLCRPGHCASADRRALRSILDNLLSNALRYTPEDGEILLAAEEIKSFVQFSVRDTGRGIEAERLSSIFDRFNPFSEKGSGLGWRWCGGWWSRWAGRLPWRAGWATEQRSASRFPWP
jgi:signal transduction histidine kinase